MLIGPTVAAAIARWFTDVATRDGLRELVAAAAFEFAPDQAPIRVTISLGVATYAEDGTTQPSVRSEK